MFLGNIWNIQVGNKLTVIDPESELTSKEEILVTNYDSWSLGGYVMREHAGPEQEHYFNSLHSYFKKRYLVFRGWDLPISPCSHEFFHKHQLTGEGRFAYLSGNKQEIRRLIEEENLNMVFNDYGKLVFCQNDQEEYLFPELVENNIREMSYEEVMKIVKQRDLWKENVAKRYPRLSKE